jgi:ribosomal protein S18 acetylase RimI-like enzyme
MRRRNEPRSDSLRASIHSARDQVARMLRITAGARSAAPDRAIWRDGPQRFREKVKDVRCRPAGAEDFTFLATMLGEAAVWRPEKPTPTADQVLADPRYAMYLAGWPRQHDFGLVAEQDGPLGAAWYRTYTELSHGYGFISEDVPELSIAVVASRRHEGIGRRLLTDLVNASVDQGYPALSLSVREQNPARGLYESVGFVTVVKHGSSWTMVRYAARSK